MIIQNKMISKTSKILVFNTIYLFFFRIFHVDKLGVFLEKLHDSISHACRCHDKNTNDNEQTREEEEEQAPTTNNDDTSIDLNTCLHISVSPNIPNQQQLDTFIIIF